MDPKDFFSSARPRESFGRVAPAPHPRPRAGFLESVEETDLGDPLLRALSTKKLVVETKTGARYSLAYNLVTGIEAPDPSEIIIHTSQWVFQLKGRNLHRLFGELHAEARRQVRELSETEARYETDEGDEAIEAIQVLNAHPSGPSFERRGGDLAP